MVERNPLIQEQGFPFAVLVVGQHQLADLGSYVLDFGFEFGLQRAGDAVLVLGVGVPPRPIQEIRNLISRMVFFPKRACNFARISFFQFLSSS